jgi:hypothetical protein
MTTKLVLCASLALAAASAQNNLTTTERNYTDCATLRSETPPESAKAVPTLKDKDGVSKALKDSLAYCAAAYEKMDDQKATSSPQMSYAFLHVLVHNNEIYGNLAGYLRSSGIVPPSTAARAGAAKK